MFAPSFGLMSHGVRNVIDFPVKDCLTDSVSVLVAVVVVEVTPGNGSASGPVEEVSLSEMAVWEIRPASNTLPAESLIAAWTVGFDHPDGITIADPIPGRDAIRMSETWTPLRVNRDRNRESPRADRPRSASSVRPRQRWNCRASPARRLALSLSQPVSSRFHVMSGTRSCLAGISLRNSISSASRQFRPWKMAAVTLED